MKSFLLYFLSYFFLVSALTAQEADTLTKIDPVLKNGFTFQLQLGISNSTYGLRDNSDKARTFKNGVLYGIQIGNRWYFKRDEKQAFGLMTNWLDVTRSSNPQASSQTTTTPSVTKYTMDFSLFEVGPIATRKLRGNQAIDGYYNLRPTLTTSSIRNSRGGTSTGGRGLTHALGVAFRSNYLYVGAEFVFGKIKNVNVFSPDDNNIIYSESDMDLKNFRILVSYKI